MQILLRRLPIAVIAFRSLRCSIISTRNAKSRRFPSDVIKVRWFCASFVPISFQKTDSVCLWVSILCPKIDLYITTLFKNNDLIKLHKKYSTAANQTTTTWHYRMHSTVTYVTIFNKYTHLTLLWASRSLYSASLSYKNARSCRCHISPLLSI